VSGPRAAVLIPTHDHVGTIDLAVGSALGQTVAEIEVLVVGDGVGEEMRELLAGISRSDPRVRFLDLPKGPHHGEVHRGTAIEASGAEIVCYLCDDDLLLPDHVESMLEQLADVDLTHSQNGYFDEAGNWMSYFADLASPEFRAWMLEPGNNRVSLTGTAHTVASYRRLPHGWRTTPAGHMPDHYMWQQFLAEPWVRARTATRVTALQFPSHHGREQWDDARRRGELEGFQSKLATPSGRRQLRDAIEASQKREAAAEYIARRQLEQELAESERDREQARTEAAVFAARIASMEATRTWRLRDRLRRVGALRTLSSRRGRHT
jgi:hypothetical protein